MSNALIVTHPLRDFLHICAKRFADVGNLVDEADARGEERIRRILDHFRSAEIGDDRRGA
jgi:hypothetical protein